MTTKSITRIKMVLYAALLILAELMQTSVFGTLELGFRPVVMPVAVACIGMLEGAETGGIFGLAGGCLWAWSAGLSFFGAWVIVILTVTGILAGLITERFLLRGLLTSFCFGAGAVILTDGMLVIFRIIRGTLPLWALGKVFLPGLLVSVVLCLIFYPLTRLISQIGGFHG